MKQCERCGSTEDLSKDHVIARFVIKTARNKHGYPVTKEQQQEFHRITGKRLNTQPLCRKCNGDKGYACIDYRGWETAQQLMNAVADILQTDIEIIVEVNNDGSN